MIKVYIGTATSTLWEKLDYKDTCQKKSVYSMVFINQEMETVDGTWVKEKIIPNCGSYRANLFALKDLFMRSSNNENYIISLNDRMVLADWEKNIVQKEQKGITNGKNTSIWNDVSRLIEEKRLVIKVRYGGYLTQERCYEAKKLLKHYKNKRS